MLKPEDVGLRMRELRRRNGLSLRALAEKAGVAVSFLSKIEAQRASPTLATLMKILEALGTGAPAFFAGAERATDDVLVVRRPDMRVLDDGEKFWRYAFPDAPGIKAVLTYEEYRPKTRQVEIERHSADVCGVVLAGTLSLEVVGRDPVQVHAGDSFYIRAGVSHAAANREAGVLRMVVSELLHTTALPLVRGRLGSRAVKKRVLRKAGE